MSENSILCQTCSLNWDDMRERSSASQRLRALLNRSPWLLNAGSCQRVFGSFGCRWSEASVAGARRRDAEQQLGSVCPITCTFVSGPRNLHYEIVTEINP
ncbi:hypothetical protein P4O66_015275 [Electrophorus voltai]|uniref:Uncharacterized protein n=1 Tax=Electrophorus voltai TaxID=2609070 RepID=A0AAD8YZ71_9TELE|nr:hypothetical protein P4O66_015275 [Electrophorus voltai]